MSFNSCVMIFVLLTSSLFSGAQEEAHEQSWEQQAANQETANAMEWEAPLHRRYAVNNVTAVELSALQLLNVLQIRTFISYREKFGNFISLMELQAIPGWDPETVRKLLPYLRLQTEQPLVPLLQQRFREGQHRFLYRWSDNSRNDSAIFKAGSHLFSHRFQFRDLLQLGFTVEKDAGERKIPDHVSGYAAMGNRGMIQQLLIGDFTVNMAQGLLHWQGYALGQTHDLVTGYRQGPLFKPHTGTDENRFHRGMAISLQKRKWEFSAFVSAQNIDAGLREDSSGIRSQAYSFQTSGLHRTVGELAGRKAIGWRAAGGRIRFRSAQQSTGINIIYHGFDKVLMPEAGAYQRSSMTGKHFAGLSLEHHHFSRLGFVFGELAVLPSGAYAMTGGWMKSLDTKFDLSLSGRMISREYAVFQSNALSSSGEAKEEKGLFINFNFRPHPQHHLDGFFDRYVIHQPRWGTDGIGYGIAWVTQYRWIPHKRAEFYVRWNHGHRNRNQLTTGSSTNGLAPVETDRWRMHLSLKPDMRWSIRIRNEWSRVMIPGNTMETGRLHYAELIYAPPLKPFSISVRATVFETGGYDTRIYAYERDVLGYYSVPAHDGKGIRCYGLMQYKIGGGHQLTAKIIHDQRKGAVQQFWRLQWTWEP